MEYERSEGYFHPEGDVYFQTEDEVLFRLPSYVLKTISTVFRDMLSLEFLSSMDEGNHENDHDEHDAKDEGGESDKDETAATATSPSGPAVAQPMSAIDLEGTAQTFEMLLDFALLEHVDALGDWPAISTVYGLSEKYDFPVARGRLAKRLFDLAPTAPWEAFVFAAQHNDLSLGRHALTHMPSKARRDVKTVGLLSGEEAGRLPVSWLVAYLTAVARTQYEAKLQWADCAMHFQPGKPGVIRAGKAPTAPQAAPAAAPTAAASASAWSPFSFGGLAVRPPMPAPIGPGHPPTST